MNKGTNSAKGINIKEKGGATTLYYATGIISLIMVVLVLGIAIYQLINLKKLDNERIERKVETEIEKKLYF